MVQVRTRAGLSGRVLRWANSLAFKCQQRVWGFGGVGEWIQVTAQRRNRSPRPKQQVQFPCPIAEEFAGLLGGGQGTISRLDTIGNKGFHSNNRRSGRYEGYAQYGQYNGTGGRAVQRMHVTLNVALKYKNEWLSRWDSLLRKPTTRSSTTGGSNVVCSRPEKAVGQLQTECQIVKAGLLENRFRQWLVTPLDGGTGCSWGGEV
jgi:hypothetical protein